MERPLIAPLKKERGVRSWSHDMVPWPRPPAHLGNCQEQVESLSCCGYRRVQKEHDKKPSIPKHPPELHVHLADTS